MIALFRGTVLLAAGAFLATACGPAKPASTATPPPATATPSGPRTGIWYSGRVGYTVAFEVKPDGIITDLHLRVPLGVLLQSDKCELWGPDINLSGGGEWSYENGAGDKVTGALRGPETMEGTYYISTCGGQTFTTSPTEGTWTASWTATVDGTSATQMAVLIATRIDPTCNCSETAGGEFAGTNPEGLRWAWQAATAEQVQSFVDNSRIEITMDGSPIAEKPGIGWGDIQEEKDWSQGGRSLYASVWSLPFEVLPIGEHHVDFTVSLNATVTNGLDFDGDGAPDEFGPGEVTSGFVDLTVKPRAQ